MKSTLLMEICLLTALVASCRPMPYSVQTPEGESRPVEGYVPDAATAITIAVAVWEPIYGKERIADQAPYTANLIDGVWVVSGSLPTGTIGGVAVAEISRQDGRVLGVSHGR
jgi:hypothetical protein